jgi:hypothetical protein
MKLRQFAGLAMLLVVGLIIAGSQFLDSSEPGPNSNNTDPAANDAPLEPITMYARGKVGLLHSPEPTRIRDH